MKTLVRVLMETASFIISALVLIALSPFLLLICACVGIGRAWDRLELWAYYNGDAAKRDKDRWRYS